MEFLKRDSSFLKDKVFLGVVEEIVDPKRIGRIKIRVQGIFDDIDVDDIPWAHPYKDLAGKTFCVPAVGKLVNVVFPLGNLYSPEYIYAEHYNINLSNKMGTLSDDEYKNFVALLFDHRTQVYSDDSELRMDYMYNNIKIREKGINIHLKDNSQELRLGHDQAEQSAVLGDHFMMWFDEFMTTLLIPTSLTGNLGAAVLKPQIDQVILKYMALRATFLSQHVKIVDNGACLDTGEKKFDAPTEDDVIKIDDKLLLDSDKVSPKAKDNVKKQRSKEDAKQKANKPAEEDKMSNVAGDGDTTEKEKVEMDERAKKVELSDSEKGNVEATNKVSQRKSAVKATPAPANMDDPYADFWTGGNYDQNSGDIYATKSSESYGSYTSTDQPPTKSSSSTATYNGKGPNETTYKGKKIQNGKLGSGDLFIITLFNDNNGRQMMLRDDAAISFTRLNDAFKKKFNKNIPVNDTYRTYDRQISERINAEKRGEPGLAAVPGTSKHGWGLAIDINSGGWDTEIVKWFKNTGSKYGWGQPSSWPYKSKSGQPQESWHWEYDPSKDKFKNAPHDASGLKNT